MEQSLWANKFFVQIVGKKKNVLFLRNWIRSGVRKIKDLSFANGILDINAMHRKITKKDNIYCELLIVKKALLPFQQSILLNGTESTNPEIPSNTKQFYKLFKNASLENNNANKYLAEFTLSESEIRNAYKVF